jgi:hypothetical protein
LATLKEQAENDINMFMETGLPWIDEATFTPQVGNPVSLNVIFEKEQFLGLDELSTQVSDLQYRVEALISDLGQIPVAKTTNRPGDFFTINGIDYEVTGEVERNNKFIVLAVKQK